MKREQYNEAKPIAERIDELESAIKMITPPDLTGLKPKERDAALEKEPYRICLAQRACSMSYQSHYVLEQPLSGVPHLTDMVKALLYAEIGRLKLELSEL